MVDITYSKRDLKEIIKAIYDNVDGSKNAYTFKVTMEEAEDLIRDELGYGDVNICDGLNGWQCDWWSGCLFIIKGTAYICNGSGYYAQMHLIKLDDEELSDSRHKILNIDTYIKYKGE